MKDQLITDKYQHGVVLLEVLIAMVILVMTITGIILVVFSNQSVTIDSQTNQEALYKAQAMLENARASSSLDFNTVNPLATVTDGIYSNKHIVQSLDVFTKKIISSISWQVDAGRYQHIQLETVVTAPQNIDGGDTCSSALVGDWAHPIIIPPESYEFGRDILNDTSSGFPITYAQAFKKKLYVTVNNINGNNPGTFFILDITNPTVKPTLLSPSLWDNNASVGPGFNAVAVDSGNYAYAANAYGANFQTCNNQNGNNVGCGQMQVIKISDSSNPQVKYTFKVPGVTGRSGQSIGKSIFYKNGIVYLGLAKTGSGPEFNMIDVGGGGLGGTPTNPKYMGGYSNGSGINAIFVKNGYAYIASPDNKELKILDISDATNISEVGYFDAPGGGANNGNGKSLYSVANTLYLGRTLLSGNEFYILNNINPETSIPSLGFKDIRDVSNNNISVNGIIVRDYLAFLVTQGEFQIYKIDKSVTPYGVAQYATPLVLPPGSGNVDGTAADCENNYFFVGSLGSNDKGYLSIIGPGN